MGYEIMKKVEETKVTEKNVLGVDLKADIVEAFIRNEIEVMGYQREAQMSRHAEFGGLEPRMKWPDMEHTIDVNLKNGISIQIKLKE